MNRSGQLNAIDLTLLKTAVLSHGALQKFNDTEEKTGLSAVAFRPVFLSDIL